MNIELEYDDDSPVAQALQQLAENAVVQTDGGKEAADVEDIADDAVRQYVAQNFQQLIMER